MARRRKKKGVKLADLDPGIAAGITQGKHADEEARERFPATGGHGVSQISHMREESMVGSSQVPLPRFVAEEDADSVWYDEPTGRVQKNVTMTFQPETIRAMQSGMICLRCLEPQSQAFPDICESYEWSGCSYPIKERQIMDFAVEFEGNKHLGPAKPISEYLQEREARKEKRNFIVKRLAGGNKKIPKEWLRDAHLFPNGVPPELH